MGSSMSVQMVQLSFEQKISNLPVIWNRSFVRAVPYMEGNVWAALGFDGIYMLQVITELQ